jgi:hypothetical protein
VKCAGALACDRHDAKMPEDQKITRVDYVMWADGELDSHARQLDRIISRI